MKIKLPEKIMEILKLIIIAISLIIAVFYVLSFISQITNPPAKKIKYGVTFSQNAAKYLKLDWKQTYIRVLEDLKLKYIRIPSYWTSIEEVRGVFDFNETDFLVNEADKRGVKIILTLGIKQPRWPECHVPDWVRDLTVEQRQQKTLELIENVVKRYKSSNSIYAWQVENEPFFYPFGDNCYPPDAVFLKKEVNTVKKLDNRPVIISETGELALWNKQMKLSDIFGTTVYRTVWNPVTGYFNYPLLPGFYSLRSNFFRIFAPANHKTIIVELQSEPWIPANNPVNTPIDKQIKIFPVKNLENNINYAKKTGFDEIYLWGVEWWYFMKENGHPEYWNYVKTLTNN